MIFLSQQSSANATLTFSPLSHDNSKPSEHQRNGCAQGAIEQYGKKWLKALWRPSAQIQRAKRIHQTQGV
jgi:hypothetical protein